MLRASSEALNSEVDLEQLEAGADVTHGELLVRYAESAVRQDSDLGKVRAGLEAQVGPGGVIEAAATVAAFEGLNRIADATGIQLDSGLADESADFRMLLGLDAYAGGAPAAGSTRAADVRGYFGKRSKRYRYQREYATVSYSEGCGSLGKPRILSPIMLR